LPEPLPSPVIDTHCHLDINDGWPGDEGDEGAWLTVSDALERAASVGVSRIVQVGCDLPSARWSADCAEQHDAIIATVALHPNEAPRIFAEGGRAALEAALEEISTLAERPRVRAIGETGMDFFRTGDEGRAIQEESFRRHIDLAKRLGKPVVIHDRESHEAVIEILESEGAPENVVFHCYSGDADMARLMNEEYMVNSKKKDLERRLVNMPRAKANAKRREEISINIEKLNAQIEDYKNKQEARKRQHKVTREEIYNRMVEEALAREEVNKEDPFVIGFDVDLNERDEFLETKEELREDSSDLFAPDNVYEKVLKEVGLDKGVVQLRTWQYLSDIYRQAKKDTSLMADERVRACKRIAEEYGITLHDEPPLPKPPNTRFWDEWVDQNTEVIEGDWQTEDEAPMRPTATLSEEAWRARRDALFADASRLGQKVFLCTPRLVETHEARGVDERACEANHRDARTPSG
jgi:TatD family hydrolase